MAYVFLARLRVRVIDDEKQMMVIFPEQPKQHIQINLLHYNRTIPDATPEEFAMIGTMSRVPQSFDEAVNRYFLFDINGHWRSPEVFPGSLGKIVSDWRENILSFLGILPIVIVWPLL
jgi:hypothetical protein